MITQEQMKELISAGGNVLSADGQILGPLGRLYVDDATGRPTWVTVDTGASAAESFVPLDGATTSGGDVQVAYPRESVLAAPGMSQDGHLSQAEEKHLLRHYGLLPGVDEVSDDRSDEHATSRLESDHVMIRSEEQLRAGTEIRETERVRLVKRIVTEEVTITVPVRREELSIERVPLDDVPGHRNGNGNGHTNGAASTGGGSYTYVERDEDTAADRDDLYAAVGSAFSGDEVTIVLYQERPVVQTEIVAVERIHVLKEIITHEETLSGEVRKEVIEAESFDAPGRAAAAPRRTGG
ncbi:YsnF/AvaK domain-containing protein [Arthrobacter zhaoguopingii]|uniref:YsnF/AvaK domain-containing protein n=1 Tax=Arthrobacter zhaoguopingii TaxID=2681491 RepID=UPI00135B5A94|nr:YsnF/AvaK domain-containing protein [Arthrobacter zhaoguopingii]